MQSSFEDVERRDDPIDGDRDRRALRVHGCLSLSIFSNSATAPSQRDAVLDITLCTKTSREENAENLNFRSRKLIFRQLDLPFETTPKNHS